MAIRFNSHRDDSPYRWPPAFEIRAPEFAPCSFAVLDVLGYGELMSCHPRDVLALVDLLWKSAKVWCRPFQRNLDNIAAYGPSIAPQLEWLQFSDTLLIWMRDEPTALQSTREPEVLIHTVSCAAAMMIGSFMLVGIPLRGAVGYGPSYISTETLCLAGSELYSTMKLGDAQAWAGAAVHESAARILEAKDHWPSCFTKWTVPFTSQGGPTCDVAIDWVAPLELREIQTPPWENMFRTDAAAVRTKGENTKAFFEHRAANKNGFHVYVAEPPVLEIRERLKQLLWRL